MSSISDSYKHTVQRFCYYRLIKYYFPRNLQEKILLKIQVLKILFPKLYLISVELQKVLDQIQ